MQEQRGNSYAVLIADVIASRRVPNFVLRRDQILEPLSRNHQTKALILAPYTVTTWDEFQTVLKPEHLPLVLFELRRTFHPIQLRVGIGLGEILLPVEEPLNKRGGGAAFENARLGLENLKSPGSRNEVRLTTVVSPNAMQESILNLVYQLHDRLTAANTVKQWQSINAVVENGGQQTRAAEMLSVSESTLSRSLNRAHFQEMQQTIAVMSRWLSSEWPDEQRKSEQSHE